jgi:hypothetical protein
LASNGSRLISDCHVVDSIQSRAPKVRSLSRVGHPSLIKTEQAGRNEAKTTSNQQQQTTMSNLNSKDYYAILGVPRGCSDAALKKAYKKLAVKVSERSIAGNPSVLIICVSRSKLFRSYLSVGKIRSPTCPSKTGGKKKVCCPWHADVTNSLVSSTLSVASR